MNVILLMAGSSEAFRDAGYLYPKPLVEIAGKPTVQHIVESLAPLTVTGGRLIVAIRQDENAKHHVAAVVKLLNPNAEILEIRGKTAGAACSALLAVDWIDNEAPLVIVNGDQIIEADVAAAVRDFQKRSLDGGIVVFKDVHPRWSFVKCGADGLVIEAAEKRPISDMATAGFYYFKSGRSFIQAAESMILKGAVVNDSYYVCPAYNELILQNCRIGVHLIQKKQYVSLATPHAVEAYERQLNERSRA
jgi:dTDP-glucose pyrophosphorylase